MYIIKEDGTYGCNAHAHRHRQNDGNKLSQIIFQSGYIGNPESPYNSVFFSLLKTPVAHIIPHQQK